MNDVFRALADPTRRHILELLKEREMTAGEIADRVTVSKPTLSGHLAILRGTELVDSEKHGTSITYRLKLSVLEDALMGFADLFEIGQAKSHFRRKPAKGKA